jgi:hypothetical protein
LSELRFSSPLNQVRARSFFLLAALALSNFLVVSGCGQPSMDKVARNDPSTAAAKAIESYDKNSDGKLAADELKASPALTASLRRLDGNRDSALSADEIKARFDELDKWAKYVGLDMTVTSRGQPLVGALVTLTPEPFMGDYPTLSGTTVDGGACPLVAEGWDLIAVPAGFYTVRIVHPAQRIDAVRGVEISDDSTGSRLQIAL